METNNTIESPVLFLERADGQRVQITTEQALELRLKAGDKNPESTLEMFRKYPDMIMNINPSLVLDVVPVLRPHTSFISRLVSAFKGGEL